MLKNDPDFYGRRPGLLSFLAVGMVGGLIGGLVTAIFAPYWGITAGGPITSYYQEKAEPSVQAGSGSTAVPDAGNQSPVVQIADKVSPAVVGISIMSGKDTFSAPHPVVELGSGSGVLINKQGYIVTNNHVVEGAARLLVTVGDGKKVEGKVVGRDSATDLAVIKIDPAAVGQLPIAILGNSESVKVGELAVAIGNPLGEELDHTVTSGIISAVNRAVDVGEHKFTLLQTDAAINPGNSGGPLVNSQGEVIGINTVKIINEKVEGLNFAIPINIAKPIINELITKGRIVRPWIGIMYGGVDINSQLKKQYGLPVDYGIVAESVIAGGPAKKAGLQDKDIIVAFNGKKITSFPVLQKAIAGAKVGDRVVLTIVRNKQVKTISLVLGEMPEQVNAPSSQTPKQGGQQIPTMPPEQQTPTMPPETTPGTTPRTTPGQ